MDIPLPASPEGSIPSEWIAFLRSSGVGEAPALMSLAGGANNRVYRVTAPGTNDRVLKSYFRSSSDQRDRFGAEQAFYRLVWGIGVRKVPEPLAWSDAMHLGLFSFIDGRKLRPEEVDGQRVREAMDFLGEINSAKTSQASLNLPAGSEACFTLNDHLACVERRVNRLDQVSQAATEPEVLEFVHRELHPAWNRVRNDIQEKVARSRLNPSEATPLDRRWISPSDFGFHNAMLAADGKLRFFDFEYAGWDDASKLICDFFCQPEVPVDQQFWNDFLAWMTRAAPSDTTLEFRAGLLLPAYRIKWCCIVLNDFVRAEGARRAFALGAGAASQRKQSQLGKARAILSRIEQ